MLHARLLLTVSTRGVRGRAGSRLEQMSSDLMQGDRKQGGRRALEVAVIGAPNVGKSLLTNQLVRAAVSAVSSRMDTTTQTVRAALTEDAVQLTVLDTPGTVGRQHAEKTCGRGSSDALLTDPEAALKRAQHILVVQDATAPGDYIHHRVLHMLHRHSHLPSSLVINKVDLIPNRTDLLALARLLTNGRVGGVGIKTASTTIGRLGQSSDSLSLHDESAKLGDADWQEKYRKLIAKPTHHCGYADTKRLFIDIRGWSHFSNVFFVSSLSGEGVDPLRAHLRALSEEGEWSMDERAVTEKSPQWLCCESTRAALLDCLPGDVAYAIQPRVVEWTEEGEVLQIVVEVPCEKERWGRLIVGKGGQRLAEIGRRVDAHMASLFQRQLCVRLLITHKGNVVKM